MKVPSAAHDDQRCMPCPTPENLRCPGLDVRRFCELIDPACPQYEPAYRELIFREAHRKHAEKDEPDTSNAHPALVGSSKEGGATVAWPADCCGGIPPGIYDDSEMAESSTIAPE